MLASTYFKFLEAPLPSSSGFIFESRISTWKLIYRIPDANDATSGSHTASLICSRESGLTAIVQTKAGRPSFNWQYGGNLSPHN